MTIVELLLTKSMRNYLERILIWMTRKESISTTVYKMSYGIQSGITWMSKYENKKVKKYINDREHK